MTDADLRYTESQFNAIVFMQQTYLSSGQLPTAEAIAEKMQTAVATVRKWLALDKFRIAMERLDIPYYDVKRPTGVLTAIQVAVIEIMLNISDRRSIREKCQEAGITVQKYNSWKADPAFMQYMNARATRMFGDAQGTAYVSILKNMENGDMNATKLYLEMTGKYQPSIRQNGVDLNAFVVQLVEVLQRRIADPALLEQLANDLENLMMGRPIDFDKLPEHIRTAIPVPSLEAGELFKLD